MATQSQNAAVLAETVRFSLDGREIEALPDETIWQAARRNGVDIPHLCYKPDELPQQACGRLGIEESNEAVVADLRSATESTFTL